MIGIAVYAIGLALRNADQTQAAVPTVAVMPTDAPTPTPTATPSPTETPTATPTETPTETPIETPTPDPPTPTLPPTDPPTLTPAAVGLQNTLEPTFGPVNVEPSPTPQIAPTVEPPTATPPPPTITPRPGTLIGTVTAPAGLTLRTGPDRSAQALAVFLQGATVEAYARSEDNAWVKVRAQGQEGWLAVQYLQLSGDVGSLPTEAQLALAGIPSGQKCVSVVGDSIAFGEVIFELPGVGFIKVKMAPFAEYVARQLAQRGITDLTVADRGYPGVGISSPVHTSYYATPLWNDLLRDRCKFTVILPWVNDMSSGLDPAFSAADHRSKLEEFARRLIANNPRGRILVLNYYPGNPAPFSKNMAYGFTPTAIQFFNAQLAQTCQEGELSKMTQVTCVDSNAPFGTLGTAYVVGPMSRQEVEAFNTRPLQPQEQKDFDYFVRVNPSQPLIGDGIHLSSLGKTVLAAHIIDIMLALPDLPG